MLVEESAARSMRYIVVWITNLFFFSAVANCASVRKKKTKSPRLCFSRNDYYNSGGFQIINDLEVSVINFFIMQ